MHNIFIHPTIQDRTHKLNDILIKSQQNARSHKTTAGSVTKPVTYWMSRDQRIQNNWACTLAQSIANTYNTNFEIVFNLQKEFRGATYRDFAFMLGGLKLLAQKAHKLHIPFKIIFGEPEGSIPKYLTQNSSLALVNDFSPLKEINKTKRLIADKIQIPFYEVDTHNIIPCRLASTKKEYAAWTFRKKIDKTINNFLIKIPSIEKQNISIQELHAFNKTQQFNTFELDDWNKIFNHVSVQKTPFEEIGIQPGYQKAQKLLEKFFDKKLMKYALNRNDPNKDASSNLSPYIHYGQISSHEIALKLQRRLNNNIRLTQKFANPKSQVANYTAFAEQLITRKELSDNFCFYEPNYDNATGYPDWAIKTLKEHQNDKREYIYTLEELEKAKTHDQLWNKSQKNMMKYGKMHGYIRMYWAKKILEWTPNASKAQKYAIYLNDTYELDGRDPNGYSQIAWAIGGVHDRAWQERKIFGKIRYMNYKGAKKKFDVEEYINKDKKMP
jgi:deoxyribodipyrimidine photo-lyase